MAMMSLVLALPRLAGFAKDHADMLRALFHLTSKIEGCDDDQIRIRPPYLNLGVDTANVDLSGGHGLLR